VGFCQIVVGCNRMTGGEQQATLPPSDRLHEELSYAPGLTRWVKSGRIQQHRVVTQVCCVVRDAGLSVSDSSTPGADHGSSAKVIGAAPLGRA